MTFRRYRPMRDKNEERQRPNDISKTSPWGKSSVPDRYDHRRLHRDLRDRNSAFKPNAITKKSGMRIQDSVAFITGANRGLVWLLPESCSGVMRKRSTLAYETQMVSTCQASCQFRLDVTDPASVSAAAVRCGDVTLLVNNAGIGRVNAGALDPALIDSAREIFETNFYGMVRASQAFAPVLSANGGGGIINVLSDATWFARPMLTAYSATKSAAWSFTNALRIDLSEKGTQLLALHVGFLDTDVAKGLDVKKSDPQRVATRTLDAREWQRGGACR